MNVVAKIEDFKRTCTDANSNFDKDHFRILIVFLQLSLHLDGVDLKDYYSAINKQVFRFLGPGHSLASCIQFMQGKKGQTTLHRVKHKLIKDMSPSVINEILYGKAHSKN